MRIYHSATVKEERLTGFQSPCSEFAEKPLSLDEKFNLGNPSLLFVRSDAHFSSLGITKDDLLLIDLSLRPNPKSLVVVLTSDEIRIFRGAVTFTEDEEVRVGVVKALFRDYR